MNPHVEALRSAAEEIEVLTAQRDALQFDNDGLMEACSNLRERGQRAEADLRELVEACIESFGRSGINWRALSPTHLGVPLDHDLLALRDLVLRHEARLREAGGTERETA